MATNRRDFFRAAAVLSAASYGRVLGANDRIRLACLGTGGRGRYLMNLANRIGGCEFLAVCDVYEPHRAKARQELAPAAREYVDYREVLDLKDIDAVFVGSPDHWHARMTTDAVAAGKDVYVEKPVTHAPQEGPALEQAVRVTNRIVQAGYQQRSYPHFIEARELAGTLGKVTLVITSWCQDYSQWGQDPIDAARLDWKRFLGSAPDQPFDPVRYSYWRWFWDFGGGHLTDLFSHLGDVVHWYLGEAMPVSTEALGQSFARRGFQCPDTINASFIYPAGFLMTYHGTLAAEEREALAFYGSGGILRMSRAGFGLFAGDDREPVVQARSTEDGTIPHVRNFLDCIRTRRQPNAPIGPAVAAAVTAHLGNQALRRGQRLETR